MSVRLDIVGAITDRLKDKVKEVRTIDVWNSQIEDENLEEEIAMNFPAVYVEFQPIEWTHSNVGRNPQNNSTGGQRGTAVITLHMIFESLKDVGQSFPEIDALMFRIYHAIQGLEGGCFGALQRTAERPDINHGRLIHWEFDFTSIVEEAEADIDELILIAAGTIAADCDVSLDIDAATTSDLRTNIKYS